MPEIKSTCCYCGVGCGVVVETDGARINGVRGDPDHPANFGRLCTKGSTLHLSLDPAARAMHPELRASRDAVRERVSWDRALDFAAEKFAAIIREHGPDSVAFYISGQLLTEDYYVFNKLAKGLIGTNNVDTNSRLCMIVAAEMLTGGVGIGFWVWDEWNNLNVEHIIIAIFIRPNTGLAEAAGLYCNRGIVVSDTMQTYDPRIYAVGECAAHRGIAYGLVAPLFEMAKVCANHLAHFGIGRYQGSVTSTKLKVTGIDLFSAGNFTGDANTEEIVLHDAVGGVYKKLVLQDNRIVGGVLYGDTVDGGYYFQLLRDKQDIHEVRDHLMFGQSNLGNSGHLGQNKAAVMADEMEVCGCNGVCKGTIVKAIKEQGLFTLDDVRKHTKASSSCGSCTGLVEQILASTVGGAYQPAQARNKPVCGCTDHTHEEVRRVIREQKLLSIPEVMKFMEWNSPNGCATCRPALNYYLISTWPHEAKDDSQSRFINERAHANIQKDGTYSVVPRMWGGSTNAAELRRIADVVDKYRIPTVKVTGGQRLDLLGVKKEDLPKVWRDLDMPSGHAYAKALRTVKTCVGSEWCRFGVQDSTNMGIALEKDLWRMYAPHKVKLAVSGCPRNCAEATIKDVGVIGVDSGWEIYVAGNGGIKAEVAQFLCKVKTHAEVLEYAGAFLQLYREEGRYLDRTVHYVARVGLDYIKHCIVGDAEGRKALYARLQYALQGEPDPWRERAAGADAREFEVLEA